MKLAVCINHVPDTAAKINIGGDGKVIDKSGVTYILGPYDEFALEECLRLREKNTRLPDGQAGEVIAISLGGDSNKETLRKALAIGADKAVLIKDDSARDSYSVARALADVLKELSPDVVFFGKQSVDYDDSAVGLMVAEMLGLPSVGVAVKIEINGRKAVVEREIEGGHEIVETTLPAVFTAQKGLNEPRYPSLKGIMAAKGKPIEERQPAPGQTNVETIAMRKPPAKNAGTIVGTDASAVPELVRLLHEEAKVI